MKAYSPKYFTKSTRTELHLPLVMLDKAKKRGVSLIKELEIKTYKIDDIYVYYDDYSLLLPNTNDDTEFIRFGQQYKRDKKLNDLGI